MPYIKQERREELDEFINYDLKNELLTPGDLNYLLTKIALCYNGSQVWNYQMINDIMGALEGAKQEFYRRVAFPYEDEKIKENGDL